MRPGNDKNTKWDAVCCSHVSRMPPFRQSTPQSNPIVAKCIPKRNEPRHAVGVPHRHCYTIASRGIVVCHACHADSFSFELRSNVLRPKVEPWIEDLIKLLVHMQRHSCLNEPAKIRGIRTNSAPESRMHEPMVKSLMVCRTDNPVSYTHLTLPTKRIV